MGREDPPGIHVILDESVQRRQVGGAEASADQLRALAAVGERPNLTLQVLPFAVGAAPRIDGHFAILTFPDPEDSPVAYLESKEEVDRFEMAWTVLARQALSLAESMALIHEAAKET